MRIRSDVGPPRDLAAFYADEHDRVVGALVLFTGDGRLAEELAQEAFVRVCQHWERVRTMDAPGAWIHRVAINLAISGARRRRTERRIAARLRAERPLDSMPMPEGDDRVRSAVAALPQAERAVLVLRFYVDLSVAETAVALGIPEGTVKTRTRRALIALRDHDLTTDHEEVAS